MYSPVNPLWSTLFPLLNTTWMIRNIWHEDQRIIVGVAVVLAESFGEKAGITVLDHVKGRAFV